MKFLKESYSWLKAIALAIIISVVINVFIFQPTKVLGSSMEPTLKNHDIIFVSKIPHTLNRVPEYGDIVIIDSRVDQKRTLVDDLKDSTFFTIIEKHILKKESDNLWVKRVIGKPGDVLELKSKAVYRNGEKLDEPYIKYDANYVERTIHVPENHIFVMGDNRGASTDSRYIGSVPIDHVLGRMIFNP